jgi:2-oxoglutarate ferredoxin oxidoreductase subunit alpha
MSKQFMQGNEAVIHGAMQAGLTFYAGYPITPASEIMQTAAEVAATNPQLKFIQFEDEIGSINAIVGAGLAGAKAMTATSGPGFSLMQEGLGLGYMTRSPYVVVDVQRVGPSTGMPTLPAQSDVMQARYGSHGDYFPIALCPSSIEETYRYTIEAFNCAEEALIPVILLMDGFVGHLYEMFDPDTVTIPIKQRNRPPFGEGQRHFAGILNKDGVARTKDSNYYRDWIEAYQDSVTAVANRYAFYEETLNPDADTLIISYGIVGRIVRDLVGTYSFFRPIRIWPILDQEIKTAADNHKNIVVIEMNLGQYAFALQNLLKRDVISIPLVGGDLQLSTIQAQLDHLVGRK